jgi:phosphoadenosine phosphosulfate reductase
VRPGFSEGASDGGKLNNEAALCFVSFLEKMTPEQISKTNAELRNKTPLEIVKWAVAQAKGRAIVSTNFRPFEAVVLHLCVQTQPDIPVLWVDHGYNRPATYQHAEELKKLLKLNLKPFLPKITAAHRGAIYGEIPTTDDEAGLKQFSALMKLEPFQRGMKELAPTVWITALRKVQNPNRAELDIVSEDKKFGTLKISPVFYWSDTDMENYLKQHDLPNEWDYFDPAKADDKRECGLHANWGSQALGSGV